MTAPDELEPILFSMMTKLLAKGHIITVTGTHSVWAGNIKDVQLTSTGRADKREKTIEVKVLNVVGADVTHVHSFNIMQPERWSLTKGDGRWLLVPPRGQADK